MNRGECLGICPDGYTRNNDPSYNCIKCDSSCTTCEDSDKFQCIICDPDFPYKLTGTGICLESCKRGYYETQVLNTCATCQAPCADCVDSATKCTACYENSSLPYLYNNQCVGSCLDGYINVFGICLQCESPCARCMGTTTHCTFCDGTEGRRILYKGQCLSECPISSVLKELPDGTLTCAECTDTE